MKQGRLVLRLRACLSGLWAGMVLAIALIAAPSLFALLERAAAGAVAGRMFMIEANLALAFAAALFLIERHLARQAAVRGEARLVGVDMLLVLGALFCTVAGHFALQPMMEAARAGQGGPSFGALHAASSALFALKGLLLLVLAWRTAAV